MKQHAEHWNEYFSAEVAKESHRATVILAAAMLEQALEAILRSTLVPVPTQNDTLFDGAYAPLASFSAKIDLSYRLGLLPNSFARDLHLVRRIRNDFAHNVTGCSFQDAAVRSRVLELTRSQGVIDGAAHLRENLPTGPVGDFHLTVSWMLWWLWRRAEVAEPIQAHGNIRESAMAGMRSAATEDVASGASDGPDKAI